MDVISTLAPVFFLVVVGALLRRTKFLDDEFFNGCAKITYWVGLPCLLLVQIASSRFSLSSSGGIFLVMFGATLLMAVVGAVVSRFLPLDASRRKTFIQTSFHCNTAFVGLPVMMVALGQAGAGGAAGAGRELMDMASMALAPMVPAVNILTILVLRGSELSRGEGLASLLFHKIALNPLVLACAGGLLLSFLDVPLPVAAERSLTSLGRMALPLALLTIGAGLNFDHVKSGFGCALTASVFNVGLLPLAGYFLCRACGFSDAQTLITLVFLACPTASSSYIYARQIAGDSAFASSVIMISTLLSGISLSVVLAVFRLAA